MVVLSKPKVDCIRLTAADGTGSCAALRPHRSADVQLSLGGLGWVVFGPELICVVCFGALENLVEAPGGIASAFPVIRDDGRVG